MTAAAYVLESFYRRTARSESLRPLRNLTEALDAWLAIGDRDAIEYLLQHADPDRLGISGCKAIITDTRPAADRFPSRPAFVAKAHAYVERVAPDRAAQLIARMR